MRNREQKTLRKLVELKAFIDKNPGATQAEWYQAAKLSRTMAYALTKNAIITNSGTKFFPDYKWVGPLPNIKMVYKLIDFQRAHFVSKFKVSGVNEYSKKPKQQSLVLATNDTSSKRVAFLEAILSVNNSLDINGFNIAINDNTAVVSRNNESITLTEPTMLSKLFKIVSE